MCPKPCGEGHIPGFAWAQKGTNEKPIVAIRDKKIFSGYENAILTYEELREIVQDPTAYESWHTALSTVNAVYLIVDRENGRKYVLRLRQGRRIGALDALCEVAAR